MVRAREQIVLVGVGTAAVVAGDSAVAVVVVEGVGGVDAADASSSCAVDVPFDIVVEDNREHHWAGRNQREQPLSMAWRPMEALDDDAIEVAYRMAAVDREAHACLAHHREEVNVH